jgi:kinesin family member 5
LQRAFAVTSAGIEGGKNLAESAQDLERTRKAINVQLAEFEGVKKSLMRDLTNRCEKVDAPLIVFYGTLPDQLVMTGCRA